MPRGAPRTIFSSASVKSAMVTCSWRRRAACSAASLARLARSAPTIPGVVDASRSRLTSGASGSERVWTARMLARPSLSGGGTATRRSNRPGRSSAASRTSGRFVAPSTITARFASKPSISVRIWFRVCSRSSLPPPKPALAPRERRLAGAGAAGEQHALGDPAAELLVALRGLEEVDDLRQLGLRLVDAGDVAEVDPLLAALDAARFRAAERADRSPPSPRAPGEVDEQADQQEHGPEPEDQAGDEAAVLVDRLGRDDDLLLFQQG